MHRYFTIKIEFSWKPNLRALPMGVPKFGVPPCYISKVPFFETCTALLLQP